MKIFKLITGFIICILGIGCILCCVLVFGIKHWKNGAQKEVIETEINDGMKNDKQKVQFNTDTTPIYNHFPDLPETANIKWYSETSTGIGLSTIKIYIFAFYDHNIQNELQDMNFQTDSAPIEFDAVPGGIDENQKWRCADYADFAFQSGIQETQKMNTAIYLNEEGNILYMEAIGD